MLVATATQPSGQWSRCRADVPFHHTSDRPSVRSRFSRCFSPFLRPPPPSSTLLHPPHAPRSLQLNPVRFRLLRLPFARARWSAEDSETSFKRAEFLRDLLVHRRFQLGSEPPEFKGQDQPWLESKLQVSMTAAGS